MAHKYVLHRRTSLAPWAFDDHTTHHRAYPHNGFNREVEGKDRFAQLILCLEHNLIFMLPLALVGGFFDPLFGLTALVFGGLHFHWYNRVHTAMHLRHKIPLIPVEYYWNHFMHHQYPNKFYCVSLPGWDWVAGTTCKMTEKDHKAWRKASAGLGIFHKTKEEEAQDYLDLRDANGCPLTQHQANGFIPTPYRPLGELVLGFVKHWQVGKIEIIGDLPQGKYVYASSHGSWKDPFILRSLIPNCRVLCHRGVMSSVWGLAGLLLVNLGYICIDKGPAGINASVGLLEGSESIGICPEGWAWMDGKLRRFHTGAARIAKQANVPIVPIYIEYQHYLPSWCLRLPPVIQYLITFLPPWQRSGAKLIIGKPITLLTGDVKEITLELEQAIRTLGGQSSGNSTTRR